MRLVMAVTMQQHPVGIPIVAVVPVQVMHFEHVVGHEAESAVRTTTLLSLQHGVWWARQVGQLLR